jgi:Tat protein secretion system quality control protein TatD with DNase activity
LSPEPYRGQVNNPNNIIYVYKKIAEIWGMRLEETEKIIDANAKKLFSF